MRFLPTTITIYNVQECKCSISLLHTALKWAVSVPFSKYASLAIYLLFLGSTFNSYLNRVISKNENDDSPSWKEPRTKRVQIVYWTICQPLYSSWEAWTLKLTSHPYNSPLHCPSWPKLPPSIVQHLHMPTAWFPFDPMKLHSKVYLWIIVLDPCTADKTCLEMKIIHLWPSFSYGAKSFIQFIYLQIKRRM